MANGIIDDIIGNPELIQNLPPDVIASMSTLITILKAAGVIAIIYFIFLIISSVLNIRRSLLIKKIYEKINKIDEKLDKLLQKKEIHSDKHKKEHDEKK